MLFSFPGRAAKGQRPLIFRLNEAHNQARGLVFWAPMGGPVPIDLISNTYLTATTRVIRSLPTVSSAQSLVGFSSNYILSGPAANAKYATTAMTMCCWFMPYSFQTSSPYISGMVTSVTGTLAQSLRLGNGTLGGNNNLNADVLDEGTAGEQFSGATELVANTLYHAAVTYDGTTAYLYLNGRQDASSSTSGIFDGGSTQIKIGTDDSGGRAPDMALADVRRYNRALTPGEIWDVAQAHPWGLYWVPGRRVFFDVGAAPPTTAYAYTYILN